MPEDFENVEPTFHSDSATLNTVFRSMSPMSNPMTGLGTGRDPSSYAQVNSVYVLSHQECIELFRSSRIARNIVTTYPLESSWPQFTFGSEKYYKYSSYSQKATDFFNALKTGSLESIVRQVSVEARLHGQSWLLLGFEDGQSYDKPINENNLISFDWVYIINYNQIQPVYNRPGYYEITLKGNYDSPINKDKLIVHESRVRKFIGDYLPKTILNQTQDKHDSALQSAYDGLSMALQSLMSANAMMSDYSLFYYKLKGLSNLVRQKKMDELYSRFLTIQMSKSVLKGLAIDMDNEDVGFTQRAYGGVKDILNSMIDYMVAESGMVRYKVLGSSQDIGLGGEGRGLQDRLQHSLNIKSYQKFNWYDNLMYILRLTCLCQQSFTKGRLPAKGIGLVFPPVLELAPDEIVALQEKQVNLANAAIDSGMLNVLEARFALFGSNEPVLIPIFTLDDRYTDQLEEEEFGDDSGDDFEREPIDSIESDEDDQNDTEDILDEIELDNLDSADAIRIYHTDDAIIEYYGDTGKTVGQRFIQVPSEIKAIAAKDPENYGFLLEDGLTISELLRHSLRRE